MRFIFIFLIIDEYLKLKIDFGSRIFLRSLNPESLKSYYTRLMHVEFAL